MVKINPSLGESIRAELDALKAQRVEEAMAAVKAAGPSPEEKRQLANKDKMLKKKMMLQKQQMNLQRSGRLALNYSEESEGTIRYCPACDKNETRYECKVSPQYWDENSQPKKEDETTEEDPRSMPSKINLAKNKLRAMGLKMSYDMEGDLVDEDMKPLPKERMERQSDKAYAKEVVAAHHGKSKEANKQMQRRIAMKDPKGRKEVLRKKNVNEEGADSLKDRQLERGGMGARRTPNKPISNTPNTFGKKPGQKYDGMSAVEKVKASIEKRYGKGAIIDTKKK